MSHFSLSHDILWKRVIFPSWKKTCCYGYAIILSLQRVWIIQTPSLLIFTIFSSGSWLWIWMCLGQVLILEYFYIDCIPPVLLKYVDQGLMCILVWVHLSITYYQNKILKTIFRFGDDTLGIYSENFLCCFCIIFVILKLPLHSMLNMHFLILHFRDMRSWLKLWCILFHCGNKNDQWMLSLIR